jgi:hypothetical protein
VKRVGILGLPGAGKTTLFEVLMQGAGTPLGAGASREHVGVVRVPDERMERLTEFFRPKKITYTQIQFVDSAAAGHASERPGKGADLFRGVRECDALVAVVRDFENPAVPIQGGVDPARDLRSLETELLLNDLAIVETRMERIAKEMRVGNKQGEPEHVLLARCHRLLEAEQPLRGEAFEAEELKRLKGFQLLTQKPLLVVYNQDERSQRVPAEAGLHTVSLALRGHLEAEIVALVPEERAAYRRELGIEDDGLTLVIRACYRLLGLVSFFTVNEDELHAWTLTRGETALDAAAEIHTDLARGFIRAEVVDWKALIDRGGHALARAAGALRLEGREYVVEDGECLVIRFNRT